MRLSNLTRPAWFCGVAIVIVGSILPGSSPAIHQLARLGFSDKLEHFVAYVALATLLPLIEEPRARRFRSALIGLVALGICLEFVQFFVPGRTPEVKDALADAAGVLLGGALGLLARQLLLALRQRSEA
jgi:VanZ family protein